MAPLKMITLRKLSMLCRVDTKDERILRAALGANLYRIPRDMTGATVIDIGAHIGSVSALCASRGAKVYAYEPIAESFALLQRNVYNNSLNVIAMNKAVGIPGMRRIYLDTSNSGSNGAYLLLNNPTLNPDHFASEEAEWVSLRSIFEDNQIEHCDLLKMDCEGAEVEILPQIVELQDRIKMIVGEIHTGMWAVPTPEFDQRIEDGLTALEPFYEREQINRHEFMWRKHVN